MRHPHELAPKVHLLARTQARFAKGTAAVRLLRPATPTRMLE